MRIFESITDYTAQAGPAVITIGNFDGVHVGHQSIMAHARELANAESLPLLGVTFNPSAVKILRPELVSHILTPRPLKIRLLAQQGLDSLLIITPDSDFLKLSPEQFVREILIDKLRVRHIVEGQTFNFGRHRKGTMLTLQKFGGKMGFQAHMVSARKIELPDVGSVAVSSTLTRQQVRAGRMLNTRSCLGRSYTLLGKVVPGRHIGREIGFPTANLELDELDQLVPDDGVYAGYARLGDSLELAWDSPHRLPAAISIGRCETFDNGRWQIEAFLLDYKGPTDSLYNKNILLSLVQRVRPQQKFENAQELSAEISNDCQRVREIIAKNGVDL